MLNDVAPILPNFNRASGSRSSGAIVSFGSFRLDGARRLLLRNGELVRIGSRALDLLIALVERAGDIVSRHELLDLVWQGVVVDEAGVRVQMAALRRALEDGQDGARYIVNVAGRGYSFVAPIVREDIDSVPPTVLPQASRSLSHAPPPPRSLIGRETVIDSLSGLLLERRFVSIVGSAGIGKTTVAAAIALRMQSEFADDNIAFVDLGAVSETGVVPGAVISALGCKLEGTDLVEELLSYVRDKRMLVVFDNCEHLIDATAFLAGELVRGAPGLHLLATSRESLRVEGETVHLLSPLLVPDNELPTAAEALSTAAVQLFMDRAVASGFEGGLTDIDAPMVAEICRRTDGIALAIEMAGSRAGAYGIRGVADLLASNVELHLPGRRNVAPRHQTLETMLDWSFNLLTEKEQIVLAHLSAFVGFFTMDAARSISGDHARAALGSLVDKSLVWVHPVDNAVFYRLPHTTRAYAATKLREIGNAEQISRRHARYFADLFKAVALKPGLYANIERHALHIGNVRKALEWSFSDKASYAIGIELAADSSPLFIGLWLLAECRHWSHLALGIVQGHSRGSQQEVRLQEALAISSMHTQGNPQEVRDAIERGLDLSQADESWVPQIRLLAGLSVFLSRLGDFDGGLDAARRCMVLAKRNGSLAEKVISEWMVGAACHLAGDQAAAVEHCRRGFKLEATVGRVDVNIFGYDHHLRAEIALARCLWLRGFPKTANGMALRLMNEAERSSLPGNYSIAAVASIPILLWGGDTQNSREHIERVIAHTEKHSLRSTAAAAWALKGEWLLMTGEAAAAVDVLRQALHILHLDPFRLVIPPASRALAAALVHCGEYDEARASIAEAISSAEKMGQRLWVPSLYRTQAEIALKAPCPDIDAAETALRKSIKLATAQAAIGWQLKAAVSLARLLIDSGRSVEAFGILRPIFEEFSERTGTRDLMNAERILASLK
ncbi:ATP-binding protein [Phyllobacterium zundukense]|uniref:Winged helix-turn-helix domain-containing protein n=1 Tax=Phyllobacterium zundukense TaxID=1867719 RepID=A0ACD4CY73_9HYPH|nr:winged helix-turn-helix domain-containing protein [Phyllobacterium zundukense]UXN58472.1 winged helix-turn-helix domain-containing protein [Phyllobacterium zundukense]